MPPGAVNPRRYDSPRRREQAAETRRKILDAAEGLFVGQGYAATAMPAIADEAGVALKTVYLAFGTKAGVLHGLWDVRLGGDDQPIPVTERPWYRQLLGSSDPVCTIGIDHTPGASDCYRWRPTEGDSECPRTRI